MGSPSLISMVKTKSLIKVEYILLKNQEGEEIKKVFDKAGLNIYTVIENHGQESEGNKLYRALQRVREDKLEMQPHTFTEIDKDFILFPANTNNYYNIILSTKDEIDQIIKN